MTFRDDGAAALDWAARYLENVGDYPVLAQVRPGDVLLAVNGTPVQSVEQVRGLLQNAEKSVALLVQRGGDKIFVPVRIG